jgi:hypothetical protein
MSADSFDANDEDYAVGYRRPPLHTRFQPGVSGNPAGRRKGTPNLKTILEQVLREQIALREGNVTKNITKAEAIIRGLVIGAMKSDPRSQMTLFRLAEQVGQFEETPQQFTVIERIIVDPPNRRNGIAEDAA